jgi:hypothetical protein
MQELEEILCELYHASEEAGKEVYVDTDVYDEEGFYIVISQKGHIGAFGTVTEEDGHEHNIFLVLDDKRVKYLHDEGFHLDEFYKAMGEKLFIKLSKEAFIAEMTK